MSDYLAPAIDPETNDFHLDGSSNLAMVHNAEAIAEHVRQRLKTFWGDWFLDQEAGVKWMEYILGKKFDEVTAEVIIKQEILDTDGVKDVPIFSVGYDQKTRGLIPKNIVILTDFDEEIQI